MKKMQMRQHYRRLHSAMPFVYCIVDEAHNIRNSNALLHNAVRTIVAEHRLLLTGTPVQNSVNDIYALMNYLMPGYLGSAEDFRRNFAKPIEKARDAKASTAEADIGEKALQRLHCLVRC